jgi:hypothetical protein
MAAIVTGTWHWSAIQMLMLILLIHEVRSLKCYNNVLENGSVNGCTIQENVEYVACARVQNDIFPVNTNEHENLQVSKRLIYFFLY